ncbi:hypothetical protein Dda_8578 [Drechslerella dactyloides]|uniref:Methionine aminopeptidase n=1 Tax=Drechslerella dactyloides TaxID=74499 RepID=A0AAD6IQV8_DREDA|nr:hypothetical protein Dda_8578 [Drechslerella dactyloides]
MNYQLAAVRMGSTKSQNATKRALCVGGRGRPKISSPHSRFGRYLSSKPASHRPPTTATLTARSALTNHNHHHQRSVSPPPAARTTSHCRTRRKEGPLLAEACRQLATTLSLDFCEPIHPQSFFTMAASDAKCKGVECTNPAGTLQCPTCLKLGIKNSYFCSQDCFKRSWSDHKQVHKTASEQSKSLLRTLKDWHKPTPYPSNPATGTHDPFPNYPYTGSLRPVYPLSPYRSVPDHIARPDYAEDGIPRSEAIFSRASKIQILNETEIEAMRVVCRLGREILDIAAAAVRPGITTDEIDEITHKATIERNVSCPSNCHDGDEAATLTQSAQSYPSPLRYNHFPKSLCTSVNEAICHGIPDQRPLEDGDIINIDISVYHGGFHADLNETYYVGEKAKADPDTVRVVETSRECLDKAIEIVKPGMLFRDPGNVIEKHAKSRNCSVVKTYCGHGTNRLFHCAPNVPHYAKNKAVGVAKPGMCFTIEPMINLGTWRDKTWPDNWTSTTADGARSAQFEHLLLVTEDGCEVLTARKPDSPGGPVPMPEAAAAAPSSTATSSSTAAPANGVNGSEKK